MLHIHWIFDHARMLGLRSIARHLNFCLKLNASGFVAPAKAGGQ